jgi:hypothetical protein
MQLSVARAPALVAELSSAPPHQQHPIETVYTASPTMRPATRFSGALLRRAVRTPLRAQLPANRVLARAAVASHPPLSNAVRSFHSSVTLSSIMPDAENPAPKESESHDQPTAAAELSTSEFHERADAYLNELVERLEEAQEKDPQIEVEYSVRTIVSNHCRPELTTSRLASLKSRPKNTATCSTSNPRTDRSGSARPSQGPSDLIGSWPRRA